jgi:DNA/RNA-binding domain of Phe-tRNA-synthetase-like protein
MRRIKMNPNLVPNFTFSEAVKASAQPLPFGLVAAKGVSKDALMAVTEAKKVEVLEGLRNTLPSIRRRIGAFRSFFAAHGFECPLPGQLRAVEQKGFPKISPFVDALLICEMANGVLMGVQDLDQIEGDLVYDTAQAGETFAGFRGQVSCKDQEIVLRDQIAVIASYFQGPDRRTRVTEKTSSLLFYVFSAPELPENAFDDALQMARDIVTSAAKAVDMEVFTT